MRLDNQRIMISKQHSQQMVSVLKILVLFTPIQKVLNLINYNNIKKNKNKDCKASYKFSKVKFASWLCHDHVDKYKQN